VATTSAGRSIAATGKRTCARFFEPCTSPSISAAAPTFRRGSLAWLATLPLTFGRQSLEGVRVAMWHARPGSDMEGIEKERTGPGLRHRLLEQAHADVLIVGHSHVEFRSWCVNVPPGKILKSRRMLLEGPMSTGKPGPLIVPDVFRPATFGVLELPSNAVQGLPRPRRRGASSAPRRTSPACEHRCAARPCPTPRWCP